MGGNDPGFADEATRKQLIKDLEEQLKKSDLCQKERSQIKRRLTELRRKPSGRQQHHFEFPQIPPPPPPPSPQQVAPIIFTIGIIIIVIILLPVGA